MSSIREYEKDGALGIGRLVRNRNQSIGRKTSSPW